MAWTQLIFIVLLLVSSLISMSIALSAWQKRLVIWSRPFAYLMLAITSWTLFKAFQVASNVENTNLFWGNLEYIGIATMPVCYFVFAYGYYSQKLPSRNTLGFLLIMPVLTNLWAWTNAGGLFRGPVTFPNNGYFPDVHYEFGIGFWIHSAYSYGLILIGITLLIWAWRDSSMLRRQQTGIVLASTLVPLIANIIHVAGYTPIDFTPLGFSVMGILMSWGLTRFAILDIAPVARQLVVDSMLDGLLVLDLQNRIVDINQSGAKILGHTPEALLKKPLESFLVSEHSSIHSWLKTNEMKGQMEFSLGTQTYEVRISPIEAGMRFNGRLLTFHDITDRKRTENELLSQKHLFQNLVIIARATTSGTSLLETLRNILDVATILCRAETGSVFMFNASGWITHSIVANEAHLPKREQASINQQVLDKGLVGWVKRQGQIAIIHDTTHDERWVSVTDSHQQMLSALAVPIIDRTQMLGVLTLTHSQRSYFTTDHVDLMQGAADQMALALHNAQLYDKERLLAERQKMLYEVIRAVGEHLEISRVAETAVKTISLYTGWSTISVLVADETATHLVVQAASGGLAKTWGHRYPIDEGVSGRAFASAETQVVTDLEKDPDYLHPVDNPLHNGVIVPLRRQEQVLGVFAVAQADSEIIFDVEEIRLAESLADAIALALDNARLHSGIQQYAADLSNAYTAVTTERSRLQALIQAGRNGIIFIGLDRRILLINETALQYLNLPTRMYGMWSHRPITELFASLPTLPQGLLHLRHQIMEMQISDQSTTTGEFEVSQHTIEWESVPVLGNNGLIGRLLVLHDVTEEHLLRRMREDLTHTTVHDLRNPLTAISVSLDLLARQVPANQARLVEIAQGNSQKMLKLVNTILDISRLESRQMPLNYQPIDLPALISETVELEATLANEKHVTLEKILPADLPPVWGDYGLIERVLQNLIGNGIKFTPRDGTVRVTAVAEDNAIFVSVFNSGSQIPTAVQERLFQKFTVGQQRERGSGLGLAFCKMVLDAHEQKIWLAESSDAGTAFTFTLGLAPKEQSTPQIETNHN